MDDIELKPKDYPHLAGMRNNGHRWIDAIHPDRPMLVILPKEEEDMFGGSGKRTPRRKEAKPAKTRRRGGF